MKTHEETLRQWLDSELGGTMPAEIREAGLALLNRLADIENAHKSVMAEVCSGGPKDAVHCTCVPVLRAEVERLRAELAASYGVTEVWQREALAAQTERAQAEAKLAKVSKAPETVFNILAGTGDGDGDE